MQTNRDIAREIQHKFDFYFLALVFTVLGFTIQTAKHANNYQIILEISSWACFALSGLIGLSRLEWRPAQYRNFDKLYKDNSLLNQAKNDPRVQQDRTDLIAELESNIAQRTSIESDLVSKDRIKYSAHKWFFIVGIVLLIVSRGWQLTSTT